MLSNNKEISGFINNKFIIFDDSEFDDFEVTKEEIVEVDAEFNKKVSKELDDYLREHPLHFED